MAKGSPRWHWQDVDGVYTLSRRLPARFDLAVDTVLPPVHPARLAHQVRQDVWRALRDLRGFAPAVRIAPDGAGLRVTAGGAVAGAFPRARAEAVLHTVLNCPARRARWISFAGAKSCA